MDRGRSSHLSSPLPSSAAAGVSRGAARAVGSMTSIEGCAVPACAARGHGPQELEGAAWPPWRPRAADSYRNPRARLPRPPSRSLSSGLGQGNRNSTRSLGSGLGAETVSMTYAESVVSRCANPPPPPSGWRAPPFGHHDTARRRALVELREVRPGNAATARRSAGNLVRYGVLRRRRRFAPQDRGRRLPPPAFALGRLGGRARRRPRLCQLERRPARAQPPPAAGRPRALQYVVEPGQQASRRRPTPSPPIGRGAPQIDGPNRCSTRRARGVRLCLKCGLLRPPIRASRRRRPPHSRRGHRRVHADARTAASSPGGPSARASPRRRAAVPGVAARPAGRARVVAAPPARLTDVEPRFRRRSASAASNLRRGPIGKPSSRTSSGSRWSRQASSMHSSLHFSR